METTRRERTSGGRDIWYCIVVVTSEVDCWEIRIDSAEVMHPLEMLTVNKTMSTNLHAKQSFNEILASCSFVA